jgi:anti-sigma-K factor RskA
MSDHDLHHENDGGPDGTEALLGAYVLDAVDEVERRRVERLLATDPDARAEVDRLNAAADQLAEAAASGARAPSDLFGSLMAQVAERPRAAVDAPTADAPITDAPVAPTEPVERKEREVVPFERPAAPAPRSRAPWILSAAAVVALFVVGALALGSRDDGTTDPVVAMQELAAEAATMPGARTGELTDADQTMAVQVVVDPEGHAFVSSGVLPALPADQTYQLWGVDGGTPVSLGLLGSDPTMSVVGVDGRVQNLAITIESAGGSAAPTSTPMASGTLQQV